jgi:hypothetical protein
MVRLPIVIYPGLLCLIAFGQTRFGSITGSVALEPGHKLAPAGFTVEARNSETGVYYKAKTSDKGEYLFKELPVGIYEVSFLHGAVQPFVRKGVVLATGGTERVDIQLSRAAGQLGSLGEIDDLVALHAKHVPPEGPTPRMPDGKPDFSGVWMLRPADAQVIFSPPVDLLSWADALVRERILNQQRDTPSSKCLPNSEVVEGLFFVKYVQSRTVLVRLAFDIPAAHQIFLDGRSHPPDPEPTWGGHSIGKWDGDTLVIDTVGFNDKSWLFAMVPHTEKLHETQRLRRPDLGHLEIETTYDDPGAFEAPAKFKVVNILFPDEEVDEYVCENNQYSEHINVK